MNIKTLVGRIRYDITNSFTIIDTWFDEKNCVLNYQPATGGWTGAQILEHVMLTNSYLLLLIEKWTAKALKRAQTKKPEFDWNNYSLDRHQLTEVGMHKSFRWIRPDHMEPQGKWRLNEIRTTLKEQEIDCLNCLDKLQRGEGFLCMTTMSVNNLGKLNVYEYIEFLTLHMIRHVTQLENNKREYFTKLK
jgi:DinB superfamily